MSDRVVWGDDKFFNITGMYSKNKFTGDKQMLSTGTISYWKTKLEVKEENVYEYHKNITKRIPKSLSYEDWSRKNNKGYTKDVSTFNRDTIKRKLIKYAGLPEKYHLKSLDELVMLVLKTWETLGLNAEDEMKNFYKKIA